MVRPARVDRERSPATTRGTVPRNAGDYTEPSRGRANVFVRGLLLAMLLGAAPGLVQAAEPCGNGLLEPWEECDDGNTASLDGCSATCNFENCCQDGTKIQFFRVEFRHPQVVSAERIDVAIGKFCGRFDTPSDHESFLAGASLPIDDNAPTSSPGNPDPSNLALHFLEGDTLTFTLFNSFKVEQNVAMRVTINGIDTYTGCIHASCSMTLPELRVYDTWFNLVELDGPNIAPYCEGYCGDGTVDTSAGEQCDDTNRSNADACLRTCVLARCGDGLVWTGFEQCDDGASNSDTVPGACHSDCTLGHCGDGVVDPGEQCDDGASNSDTAPNACRTDCRAASCGDAVVDSGEECDDGNFVNTDACRNDCSTPSCGDATLDPGEVCDDGNRSSGDGCSANCASTEICGNAIVELAETCDDGNFVNTDACLSDCTLARCGDGWVHAGVEACDHGAANSDVLPDACRTDCTSAHCGDGVVDSGEPCDDGNLVESDGCHSDCTIAACGDGEVDPGEECDDGAANSDTTPNACRSDCTDARCGDAVVDDGEQCDDGNSVEDDGCRNECVLAVCGNAAIDPGEECDDGNASSQDACLTACRAADCGDGFVWNGYEDCDDANGSNNDACLVDCTDARCGDGHVHTGVEECDDGNFSDRDACLRGCIPNVCGDGFVHLGVEHCDDGNVESGDGCRFDCTLEICGDAIVDAEEECDDGNGFNYDACLADCTPASCGDGFVHYGIEECDDGNLTDADGCDAACLLEPTVDEADLAIVKTDSPDPVRAGARLGHTITVSNRGPGTARVVVVTDTLDAWTRYVSANMPCVEAPPGLLRCQLGAILTGASTRLEITVAVDDNAPTQWTTKHGVCTGAEDLCNRASVASATPDPSPSNDIDSEPTDAVPGGSNASCGNGIVDAGESCDPPGSEDCANLFDDDFDGLSDCEDPDCLTGAPTCSLNCEVVPRCRPILRDPAELRFRGAERLGRIDLHARVHPLTPIDLYTEEVGFALSNSQATFFRARLLPGDLLPSKRANVWRFVDEMAPSGLGIRGGVHKFWVEARVIHGDLCYAFRIKAYADLSAARYPAMTTEISYGRDIASLTAVWSGHYGKRWYLKQSQIR